ncbi:helix-turn-helix domain-containing protein [Planktotalea sp.]|uniref:helix-turn-helix domain-containing protein n=1 Tax=Planktotalea sp. TaxID=2029877 RepID=UPI003D6AF910
MGKRANPMRIKSALTYTPEEAAKALSKSTATIRNWVKDGLPVMASRKPMLISGLTLRTYIQEKNKAAKQPLEADELTCLSCRAGRRPEGMRVSKVPLTTKTSLLKGVCVRCGATATRIIAVRDIPQFTQIFHLTKGAKSEA